jgi:RimJ/RimL family protein N-acetyltransferase
MRLQKIYHCGKILNEQAYNQLKELDAKVFYGCNNEFKKNRDWWVVLDNGNIIAYCGCLYSYSICIFVRAWVHYDYRGKGLHGKMIKSRINAAKKNCKSVITYTTHDNSASANNLIKNGFKLYIPEYLYAGEEMIYFKKNI